jgi:vacuole morphology and inheritance protein 14
MDLIPSQVYRSLGDKFYEKRKAAALEIEKLILGSKPDEIQEIISVVSTHFVYSPLQNSRNGGLIALAAVS